MVASRDSAPPRFPPAAQGRPPSANTQSHALPIKSPHHNRQNSLSSGNLTHRVTRRKSTSFNSAANMSAVVQAVKEAAEVPFSLSAGGAGLGKSLGKTAGKAMGGSGMDGYPSPPSSLPTPGPLNNGSLPPPPPAVIRGSATNVSCPRNAGSLASENLAIPAGNSQDSNLSTRSRRASEGAHVLGEGPVPGGEIGETKSSRTRSGSELKCDKCGKGYKHSSCLTKHLWEHTPEWSYTSKLLISKHQQVQLLEAASILVSMNPTTTPPASSSGSNEGNSTADSFSSSEDTTPPPPGLSPGIVSSMPTPRGIRNGVARSGKRLSSGSYSRSLQPPSSNGLFAGSAPSSTTFPSHFSQRSARPRAGSSVSAVRASLASSPALQAMGLDGDDEVLAAAVELLSCSFNTPILAPTIPPGGVPGGGIGGMYSPPAGGRSFIAQLNDVVEMKKEEGEFGDVRMEDLEESAIGEDEDDVEWTRRGRSEEDEDGVFGRMEE